MSVVSTLRIYRSLLRQAGVVRRGGKPLALSKAIDVNAWGSYRFGNSNGDEEDSLQPPPIIPGRLGDLLGQEEAMSLQELMPRDEWPLEQVLTGTECEDLVKRLFRRAADNTCRKSNDDEAAVAVRRARLDDLAFTALRIANALISQWYRSSVTDSDGVRVILDYVYVQPDQSGRDIYAYRLIIENKRDHNVQLLGRHWLFEDNAGAIVEVPRWGEGVVGLQPCLRPGQWLEYVSGTTLEASPGVMQGALLMVNEGGESWEAEVARLELAAER